MKGHDHILHALALNPQLSFELAGDGEYLEILRLNAKQLNVSQRSTFHGHLSNFDELKSRADVFIMASTFEGVPMALLEAVVSNIPCVCNDIPQLREMFSENEVVFCDVAVQQETEFAAFNW